MLLDDLACCIDPYPSEAVVRRQFDARLKPELRVPTRMLHVYVRPRPSREKK